MQWKIIDEERFNFFFWGLPGIVKERGKGQSKSLIFYTYESDLIYLYKEKKTKRKKKAD